MHECMHARVWLSCNSATYVYTAKSAAAASWWVSFFWAEDFFVAAAAAVVAFGVEPSFKLEKKLAVATTYLRTRILRGWSVCCLFTTVVHSWRRVRWKLRVFTSTTKLLHCWICGLSLSWLGCHDFWLFVLLLRKRGDWILDCLVWAVSYVVVPLLTLFSAQLR